MTEILELAEKIGVSGIWLLSAAMLAYVIKEPLQTAIKARELRAKEREFSLSLLKNLTINPDTKALIEEQLIREEFRKAFGVRLTQNEREALIPVISSGEPNVRWSDVRDAYDHISISETGSELLLTMSMAQWSLYWLSRLLTTFLLLLSLLCIFLGIWELFAKSNFFNKTMVLGLVYLMPTLFMREVWVGPLWSYNRLVAAKARFQLAISANLVEQQAASQSGDLTSELAEQPEEMEENEPESGPVPQEGRQ